MFLELLAAILIGIACGIITGLTPGVHINLVSALLLSAAPLLLANDIPLIAVGALITAMAITHSFLDTIPSIFLGAPDDDKALGVLPGHRYLLRGNGLMAVKLSVIGGALGTTLAAILLPAAILTLGAIYEFIRQYLFWVLAGIIAYLILRDKKRLLALIIFTWSGLLGLVVLRLPMRDPLLPLLSGMFGVATLIYSLNDSQQIPEQHDHPYTELDGRKTVQGSVMGFFAGSITALLPGISASAAAAVSSQGQDLGDHGFLILLGSLGSASFILSFAAFVAFEKARNGATLVITELVPIDARALVILVGCAFAATGLAALITLWFGRRATKILPKMPYRETCLGVIAFLILIVLWRSSWIGLVVLATSTAVGLMPAALKTARAQAMGCLLLPTLVLLW
jgi:putative membrane protein